jgi:hypothetical protein
MPMSDGSSLIVFGLDHFRDLVGESHRFLPIARSIA